MWHQHLNPGKGKMAEKFHSSRGVSVFNFRHTFQAFTQFFLRCRHPQRERHNGICEIWVVAFHSEILVSLYIWRDMIMIHHLQPSHRRSLYTLSSSMLILSAKLGDLPDLAFFIEAHTAGEMADPYLHLVEDGRLLAVCVRYPSRKVIYGSEEDKFAALKFIESIKSNDDQLRETVLSHLLKKYKRLPEQELMSITEQLQQEFSSDVFPLGTPAFMDTPIVLSPSDQKENETFDEVLVPALQEDEPFFEAYKVAFLFFLQLTDGIMELWEAKLLAVLLNS
ncbi:hypothetical protein MA16_Dca024056 [Dendrobium catenatum]|uniref:Uncharacterized protein n=1 Tax=Dendrobium catenatum TaxID=906689 RepID=A0A2I0VG94_9ASPA|nr:hypothetical protein MA16_Dca024056 [Dendrobium catenatum]